MKNLLVLSMLIFMGIQLNAQGLVLQRGTIVKKFKPDDLIRLTIPTGILDPDGSYCNYLRIEGKVKHVSQDSIGLAISSYISRQVVEADTKVEDWIMSPNMALSSTISIDDILEIQNLKSHKCQLVKYLMGKQGNFLLMGGIATGIIGLFESPGRTRQTLLALSINGIVIGSAVILISKTRSYKMKDTKDPWQIVAY